MRGFALVLLAGCTLRSGDPGERRGLDSCRSDAGCAMDEVCARTGYCLATSLVRTASVNWLVSGKTPDDTTCSPHPDLQITLHSSSGLTHVSYSPVPCIAGRFTVDKLPTSCDFVELGPTGTDRGWRSGRLDAATGETTLDLSF